MDRRQDSSPNQGPENTHPTAFPSIRILFVTVICVSPLLLFGQWWTLLDWAGLRRSTISDEDMGNSVTILLWHWPFGGPYDITGDVCRDRYDIPRCRLVDDRALYPSADVVVFHNRELMEGREKLPLHLPRPPGQRWAWMSLEAPDHNGNLRPYANVFNLTVSYRRDADVTIPYGERRPKEPEAGDGGGTAGAAPRNKSATVCWVVSNYRAQHARSRVYGRLKAVVPVQVYGRWTGKPLPPRALLPTISRCYFYLAFENSESKDYVTEKLWRNSYQAGAVPIVLGPPPSDYKAVAPPGSFIHVDEFVSAEDLGRRLKELAADEEGYGSYFGWRQEWEVKLYTDWRERLCRICSRYDSFPRRKVYADLNAWAAT